MKKKLKSFVRGVRVVPNNKNDDFKFECRIVENDGGGAFADGGIVRVEIRFQFGGCIE